MYIYICDMCVFAYINYLHKLTHYYMLYAYVYTQTPICTCTPIMERCVHACDVCLGTYVYVHLCIYAYMYGVGVHMCMYVYIHAYLHTYIHTYIHILIYTYTYTYVFMRMAYTIHRNKQQDNIR